MSSSFKVNQRGVNALQTDVWNGIASMLYDVQANAQRRAPVVTGDLRRSIHQEEIKTGEHLVLVAGGSFNGIKVDYAAKREAGPNRDPSTEHYMANAFRDVVSGDWLKRYFGDIGE